MNADSGEALVESRSFVVGEGVARRCICYDCVLAFADEIKKGHPPPGTPK